MVDVSGARSFYTWNNGLQLFCKTGNVRNQYRTQKPLAGSQDFTKCFQPHNVPMPTEV